MAMELRVWDCIVADLSRTAVNVAIVCVFGTVNPIFHFSCDNDVCERVVSGWVGYRWLVLGGDDYVYVAATLM